MLNSTPSGWRPRGHPYPHIIYMAQSKSFFGLRRGSTKTLTFSVYNGKQVTKDRVTDVKNPRSSAQMKQRAIMATALRGYSALKEICDHSFEGVTYGQKSMNYFVAENARMIRSAAPNVNLSLSKGNSVSNAYIIAKGSLPTIPLSVDTYQNDKKIVFVPHASITSGFTFGKLMEMFGATEIGDMVTFVNLIDNPDSNASIYWVRFKLTSKNVSKSIDTAELPARIWQDLVEGEDFETNIDNFTGDEFAFTIVQATGGQAIIIGDTWDGIGEKPVGSIPTQSLGAILSRKTDSVWLRSSSTMVNLTNTFNYADALASYPESGEKILNGGNV